MKHKNSFFAFGLSILVALNALAGNLSSVLKAERWYYTPRVHGNMKKGPASHRADLEMQKAMNEVSEDWKFREDMTRDLNSDKIEIAGLLVTKDYGKTGLIETLAHKENGETVREVMTIPTSPVTPRKTHLNFHHDPDELFVISRNNHGRIEERIPLIDEMYEMSVKEIEGTKYRATKTWEMTKTENKVKTHTFAEIVPKTGGLGEDLMIEVKSGKKISLFNLSLSKNPNDKAIHFVMEGDLVKVYSVKTDRTVTRIVEDTYDLSKGTLLAERQRKTRYILENELIQLGLVVNSQTIRKAEVVQAGKAARGMVVQSAK